MVRVTRITLSEASVSLPLPVDTGEFISAQNASPSGSFRSLWRAPFVPPPCRGAQLDERSGDGGTGRLFRRTSGCSLRWPHPRPSCSSPSSGRGSRGIAARGHSWAPHPEAEPGVRLRGERKQQPWFTHVCARQARRRRPQGRGRSTPSMSLDGRLAAVLCAAAGLSKPTPAQNPCTAAPAGRDVHKKSGRRIESSRSAASCR